MDDSEAALVLSANVLVAEVQIWLNDVADVLAEVATNGYDPTDDSERTKKIQRTMRRLLRRYKSDA